MLSIKDLFLLPLFILAAVPASANFNEDVANCQLQVLPQFRYTLGHAPRQPSTAEDFYCLGIEATGVTGYHERNDAEAARWWRRAADLGHAGAQGALGNFYAQGRGVSQSYAEALKWFRRSADQGNADSMYAIGGLYEEGLGVPKDQREADRWFGLAKKAGASYAQANRPQNGGRHPAQAGFEEGERLYNAKNYRAAADQFLKAAQAGNPDAQLQIAYQYQYGEGVQKNSALAAQWYRQAAGQGDARAQANLGNMYEAGEGVPEDWVMSAEWRIKSAEQGNAEGMVNLRPGV